MAIDSLEAIARNAPEEALRVDVAVDAQRGDAYLAGFAREAPGAPLLRIGPTRIEPVEGWAATLGPETLVLGPDLGRLLDPWPGPAPPRPGGSRPSRPLQTDPAGSEALRAGRSWTPSPSSRPT